MGATRQTQPATTARPPQAGGTMMKRSRDPRASLRGKSYADQVAALRPTENTAADKAVAGLHRMLAPTSMATALQGSSRAVSVSVDIPVSFAQVGLSVAGTLSRDDDRQFRLNAAFEVRAGAGVNMKGLVAMLQYGRTWKRTWSFKDWAAYKRWLALQVDDIRRALLRWGASKQKPMTAAERAKVAAKSSKDGNVTGTGTSDALIARAEVKGQGGSLRASRSETTYRRRNAHGVLQQTKGVEKRLDLSATVGPLKITGFYQDMQGHANSDMDGEYVNLTVQGNVPGKARRGGKAKGSALSKVGAQKVAGQAKGALKRLSGGAKGAAGRVGQGMAGFIRPNLLLGLGFELEWVKQHGGLNLRFVRVFEHAGVGGSAASAGARNVLHEVVGTTSLNYLTQLYNGYARLGKPGQAQWVAWCDANWEQVREAMIAIGTPGTPAHAEMGAARADYFVKNLRNGIFKRKRRPSKGLMKAFRTQLESLCRTMRAAGATRWQSVGAVEARLATLGPQPAWAKQMTATVSVPGFATMGELLKKGASARYHVATLGSQVLDDGGTNYARMAKELGLGPTLSHASFVHRKASDQLRPIDQPAFDRWFVRASLPNSGRGDPSQLAAAFMKSYVRVLRAASTSHTVVTVS